MNYGKAIHTVRKQKKLSQKDFSKLVGIDQSYLSMIENNKKRPSTKLLDKISESLEVPIPILFFFSLSENDIPNHKKELFRLVFPRMKEMLSDFITSPK